MFYLFLRHLPAFVIWFVKQIAVLLYRNLRLQAIVLVPIVLVLLLMPAMFSTGDRQPQDSQSVPSPSVSYQPARNQPSPAWTLDR